VNVRNQGLWAQQCAELQENQTGRDFLEFIETWVTQAEQLYEEDIGSPATALRHALDHADQTHGRVGIHFLGQMLVVVATHWEHGEEMAESLTPIELRLVQDMLALKCAELQDQAEEDPVVAIVEGDTVDEP
jgi:hypothetical protein